MATEVNGRPIRERGGRVNRASRKLYIEPRHDRTATAAVGELGGFNEHLEVEEDRSLTRKLHLKLFPQTVETETRKTRQLDQKHYKETGEVKLVETTDQRVVWMSDKTLLDRTKRGSFQDNFKRVTSHTKRRLVDPT